MWSRPRSLPLALARVLASRSTWCSMWKSRRPSCSSAAVAFASFESGRRTTAPRRWLCSSTWRLLRWSAARAERIADEANRARDLACLATERNQLRSPAVPATEVLDAANLSLWLAARLPLTARLQADLLATTCPLRRIQDVVDAMRLLTESTPRRKRTGHRFRLLEADEEDESLFVVDKSNDRLAAPM